MRNGQSAVYTKMASVDLKSGSTEEINQPVVSNYGHGGTERSSREKESCRTNALKPRACTSQSGTFKFLPMSLTGAATLFSSVSSELSGDSQPQKLKIESGCEKAAPLSHLPVPDKHPPTGRPGRHMATRARCQNLRCQNLSSWNVHLPKAQPLLSAVFSLEDSSSESYKKQVRIDEASSCSLC